MSAAPKLMAELKPEDFTDYFAALHGVEPFPWQARLAAQLCDHGRWPEAIELPTAAGKTAVLDIAVFALALDAQRPATQRKVPRRVFFCIDRRIVVDEAERRARFIAERLDQASDGILARVATLLKSLGGDELPLHVSKMRGGVFRDSSWARSPSQPTICLTTIDQLGSRLLFRGYGLRHRAFPIHAGLIAYDSLIVLDEVHISRPFEETLSAVQRYGTWAERPLARSLQFVRMSATAKASKPFLLKKKDRDHPVLGPRITARKLAQCGKPAQDRDQMIARICTETPKMISETRRVLAIVVNRVATARAIFEALRQNAGYDTVLLTGRVRPFERDALLEEILPRVRARRDRSVEQKPLVVVATQCIEVGADFDFDAMITECAPIDSLRQRFGRLDRLGELQETEVLIVANREDLKDDLIYGLATAATWKWLDGKLPKRKKGSPRVIDVGTCGEIYEGLSAEQLEELSAPVEVAPTLQPAHCDIFAQTSPLPGTDCEPGLFLHGPENGAPDVYLVWRAELDAAEAQDWADRMVLPPITDEALPLPIYAARAFLSGGDSSSGSADIESVLPTVESPTAGRQALRWKGDDTRLITAAELRPGDTLIVPASYGGCDRFGWHPQYDLAVEDIADAAAARRRQSTVLRIHPSLIQDGAVQAALGTVLDTIEAGEPRELIADGIQACLSAIVASPSISEPQRRRAEALIDDLRYNWKLYPSGDGLLIEARHQIEVGDEDEAGCAGQAITLAAHSEGVRDYARRFAEAVGLPRDLVDDLGLSGWGHDVGKADPRFQIVLYRGSEITGDLLAKSGMDRGDRRTWLAARERSGYPPGARHECQSVALVASNQSLLGRAHDPDLVLHLIASHHGCCRPFASAVQDLSPVTVRLQHGEYLLEASSAHGLERLDSGVADRFWRLIRRYGWFGLAYLEAILRLADHRRSEDEQREEQR